MTANLERAFLLYDQSRYSLAEAELRLALAENPDDVFAHALRGLCLVHLEQFQAATDTARQAVALGPDVAFAHYALAQVLQERERQDEARAAIQEALRLDASEPDYYSLLAAIELSERRWPAALEAAEQGLQLHSEHVGCANLRAMALVKLGRKAEAGATIESALARDPGNSLTHANQGWTLLEKGDPKRALEHFQEALRLDSGNEWARQGIVAALKARHLLYAIVLRYFLWMSRFSVRTRWGIVVGGYFGSRVLSGLARSNPGVAPYVLPLQILYLVFALMTWLADPLFNLLLRLNRFGRLALSRDQTVAANWVGLCLLLALLALGKGLLDGFVGPFRALALVFGLLLLPLAGTFKCRAGWPRRAMGFYTGGMAIAGLLGIVLWSLAKTKTGELAQSLNNAGSSLAGLFFIGAIGSSWVANILISQRRRK